jgi:hypothetical protein
MNSLRIFKDKIHKITSRFGMRMHPIHKREMMHYGTDYSTGRKKSPQYAIGKGKVVRANFDKSAGNFAYVEFPEYKITLMYAHLDEIMVQKGDVVDEDTIIGLTGTSGVSTAIHAHIGAFKASDLLKPYTKREWYNFDKLVFNVGAPIERDLKEDQIEININKLRIRQTPEIKDNILGHVRKGFYNIENINGDWVEIDCGFVHKDFVIVHKKEVEEIDHEENVKIKTGLKEFLIELLEVILEWLREK